MKNLALFAILAFSLLASSCSEDHLSNVDALCPVYGTIDDLEKMISSTDPQPILEPGKIYVKDDYLFINETLKGIHVYDNADPSNPLAIAFISIPGNVDVAMKGDYLYADYNNGLATIDLSDIYNAKLLDFNSEYNSNDNGQLYPPMTSTSAMNSDVVYFECPDAEKGLIIGWEKKNIPQPNCYINTP